MRFYIDHYQESFCAKIQLKCNLLQVLNQIQIGHTLEISNPANLNFKGMYIFTLRSEDQISFEFDYGDMSANHPDWNRVACSILTA